MAVLEAVGPGDRRKPLDLVRMEALAQAIQDLVAAAVGADLHARGPGAHHEVREFFVEGDGADIARPGRPVPACREFPADLLRVAWRQVEYAVDDEEVIDTRARTDFHELLGNPGRLSHPGLPALEQRVGAVGAMQGTASLRLQRFGAVVAVIARREDRAIERWQVVQVQHVDAVARIAQLPVAPAVEPLHVLQGRLRTFEFLEQAREGALALAGDTVIRAEVLHQGLRRHREATTAEHDRCRGIRTDRPDERTVCVEVGRDVRVIHVLQVAQADCDEIGPMLAQPARNGLERIRLEAEVPEQLLVTFGRGGHHVQQSERDHGVRHVLPVRGDECYAHRVGSPKVSIREARRRAGSPGRRSSAGTSHSRRQAGV